MLLRKRKIALKIRDWLQRNPECLHYLLDQFHVFEPTYIRGGQEAERETQFREGRQSAGLDLLNIANMSKQEVVHLRGDEMAVQAQEQEEMIDDG